MAKMRIEMKNCGVLKSLDIKFNPATVHAVTGDNGSGKSTFIQAFELPRLFAANEILQGRKWEYVKITYGDDCFIFDSQKPVPLNRKLSDFIHIYPNERFIDYNLCDPWMRAAIQEVFPTLPKQSDWSEGQRHGISILTLISRARLGDLLVFDNFEAQLAPATIRMLLHWIRKRADDFHLCVVLTTQSPVVLDTFRDDLDQVFLFEHGSGQALTKIHSPEWLAQVNLGDLYSRGDLGTRNQ